MMFTSHLLAGAAIGSVVGSPASAGLAGLASHVAMDVVPHWGDRRPGRFLAVARVDGLVGLAAASAALVACRAPRRPAVLAGMVGAGMLDLNKPTTHFIGASLFPAVVDDWHARIQHGRERPERLRAEVLAAAGLAGLALVALRRR
ncbi:MAG: hypothetical protein NVSMB13_08330 [Mycobacteriales bacterium]